MSKIFRHVAKAMSSAADAEDALSEAYDLACERTEYGDPSSADILYAMRSIQDGVTKLRGLLRRDDE